MTCVHYMRIKECSQRCLLTMLPIHGLTQYLLLNFVIENLKHMLFYLEILLNSIKFSFVFHFQIINQMLLSLIFKLMKLPLPVANLSHLK